MIRYAYIMPNDFINGKDVSVSVWFQGCPFHCEGCHNRELWGFDGGKADDDNTFFTKLKQCIEKNNFVRNLSVLGGEPLCPTNLKYAAALMNWFKERYPNKKIFLWTGYYFEEMSPEQKAIATMADTVIDGPFVLSKRDVSLELRGSSNQHILTKGKDY